MTINKKDKMIINVDIESWLHDYEQATGEPYGDPDTLDGSAYILLSKIYKKLNSKK